MWKTLWEMGFRMLQSFLLFNIYRVLHIGVEKRILSVLSIILVLLSAVLLKQDKKTLERIWSDNFVFTNPSGKVSRKAERLAGLKPTNKADQPAFESNRSNKIDVYSYNDSAALATVLSKVGNDEVVEQYQATHFWVKKRGRWRLVAAHVSLVAK